MAVPSPWGAGLGEKAREYYSLAVLLCLPLSLCLGALVYRIDVGPGEGGGLHSSFQGQLPAPGLRGKLTERAEDLAALWQQAEEVR